MTMTDGQHEHEEEVVAPSIAQQIDENLKRLYQDAASEDLPQSLTELLDKLRGQDSSGRTG